MASSTSGPENRMRELTDRLLRDRIILLGTPIDEATATTTIAQLLYLEDDHPDKPIHLYLNSPGGLATAGLAILETMPGLKCPVHTTCIGHCSGMAALILVSGHAGHRSCIAQSVISLVPFDHRDASDPEIAAREIGRLTHGMTDRLRNLTRLTSDQIRAGLSVGLTLRPEQALEAGIVDEVLAVSRGSTPPTPPPTSTAKPKEAAASWWSLGRWFRRRDRSA